MAGKNVVQAVGPSYHLTDRKAAVQSAVNLYLESIDGLGESRPLNLVSIPGTRARLTSGEFRGCRYVNGLIYVVMADSVLKYNPTTLTYTGLSSRLISSSGFVGMTHNSTQLALVDGSNLYVIKLATDVMTLVGSTGWRGSDDVYELDGYAIFVDPGTDQFYISAIDDFTSLNPLDFSSADSIPDDIITHRVLHREIWFFGDVSGEIWVDSGDQAFPFVRYNSATLEIGVVGKRAAIVAADSMFWIGKTARGSGIVYMARGHQPVRVSIRPVEQALLASTDITQASMWTYQADGHEFVGVNAPGLEKTWVYDVATQQWSERGKWFNGGWIPYHLTQFVSTKGATTQTIFAGSSENTFETLTNDIFDFQTQPLVRERTWPHLVSPSLEPISFRGLELGCTTGYGGQVTLEISNDGGYTFGPPLLRSLGEIGQFMRRVRWLGLGTAFDRVYRVRCSDSVPFNIYSASVDT